MAGNVRPPKYGNRYGRRKVAEVINVIVTLNPTDAEIAQMTGVCEKTIYRWYQQEWFIDLLRIAYHRIYEPGNIILRQEYKKTVEALVKLRDDTLESAAVRLGAMRTLMEYSRLVHLTDQYDAKLKNLELKTIDAVDSGAIANGPETSDGSIQNNHEWWKDQPQDWQQ
jgi:hypothetical protein